MESLEAFCALLDPWFTAIAFPPHLREALYRKLRADTFDAGDAFALARVEPDDEEETGEDAAAEKTACDGELVLVAQRDIAANSDVWLVDHAFTFKIRDCVGQLAASAQLRTRIGALCGVLGVGAESDGATPPGVAEAEARRVHDAMWRIVGSYKLPPREGAEASDSDFDSVWFVHDEVGSAVRRVVPSDDGDDEVNVALVPMPVCFPEKGCVFSIAWPTRDLEEGDIAAARAQFASGGGPCPAVLQLLYGDNEQREHGAADCVAAFLRVADTRDAVAASSAAAGGAPIGACAAVGAHEYPPPAGLPTPLPFFTDSTLVATNVTDSARFQLVPSQEGAAICYMCHYAMRRSDEMPHAAFVSQLPEERLFTNKRGLARCVQQAFGHRAWFAQTYDVSDAAELAAFAGDMIVRAVAEAAAIGTPVAGVLDQLGLAADSEALAAAAAAAGRLRGRDGTNVWIAKPQNLARSADTQVSPSLPWLLRIAETSPKVCCKYISNTCTFRGRKFDLRYVLAVRSLATPETPLEAYAYDVFFTRFGSEPYSLDAFESYGRHMTVFNYADPSKLMQVHYDEFTKEFDAAYAGRVAPPPKDGADAALGPYARLVHPRVMSMLREVLLAVPVDDIPHARFRAIYGVDVMVREVPMPDGTIDLQPVLLEITFSPDCGRACKYHPTFFNDVFSTLFLGQPQNFSRL